MLANGQLRAPEKSPSLPLDRRLRLTVFKGIEIIPLSVSSIFTTNLLLSSKTIYFINMVLLIRPAINVLARHQLFSYV
jgi:hypothetical protein